MKYKYVILAVAVVLIAAGVMMEETQVVLQKAVRICLECIGIG